MGRRNRFPGLADGLPPVIDEADVLPYEPQSPGRWYVASVGADRELELEQKLADGWEPFAVANRIWLRRMR